jgi:lipopolysaccharide transport system permease protein
VSEPTGATTAADDLFAHDRVTVIEPRRAWRLLDFRELWAYRELLWVLAGRDIRVRYKQTVLGAGWALLRPLLAMGIFSVVFGRMAKMPSEGAPYPVFVLAALLPWTFFSTATGRAAESLVGAQTLVSKVYFPRLIIPLSQLGVALVDLGIGLVLLAAMSLAYGLGIQANILLLPVALVLLLLAALGVGTALSALSVAYRDVRHVAPFLLQVWLFATPVVYPASLFPERWRWALYLNPVAGPVEAFRAIFLGRAVDPLALFTSFAVSSAILLGAILYFDRVEARLADIV